MIRRLKNIGLLLFALLIIKGVNGQSSIDNRTTQKINLKALSIVERYQFLYDMRKRRDDDNFKDLFEETNAELFNDIMPDNNLDSIVSKDQYVKLFHQYYAKPINIEIEPLEISPIRNFNDGKGDLSIFAKKIMSGNTDKNIDYIDTFYVEIIIKFNLNNNSFKIKSVKSVKSLGVYCVIEAYSKRLIGKSKLIKNDILLLNNRKIITNNKGQYLLRIINDTVSYKIESQNNDLVGNHTISDETIKKYEISNTGDKNTRIIEFRYPYFFIEPFTSFNPFKTSPIHFTGNNIEVSLTHNFSYNTGFNLGLLIIPKCRVFIKTGLHYKNINYTADMEQYIYKTNQIDTDNYAYIRTNDINSISEETKLSYYVIPAGIFKNFKLKHFNINTELGVQWHKNISATYSTTAKSLYSGYYKNLHGIIIRENGVYDFGEFEIETSDNLNSVTDFFTMYSSIGIGRYLNKRTSINFDLLYNYGFNNIFNKDERGLSNKKERINSITNISNDFVLREIYLSLNLKYKF